jgi:hypothetical protein
MVWCIDEAQDIKLNFATCGHAEGNHGYLPIKFEDRAFVCRAFSGK